MKVKDFAKKYEKYDFISFDGLLGNLWLDELVDQYGDHDCEFFRDVQGAADEGVLTILPENCKDAVDEFNKFLHLVISVD